MRITEIKSQNIKIQYKPAEETLSIGDFVSFSEGAVTLIAQVYEIFSQENSGGYNYAQLNFVLSFKYGKIASWRGEEISLEAKVQKTPFELIENYINSNCADSFALGYQAATYNKPLKLSFENFQTPAFVGYERQSDINSFIDILSHQFLLKSKKLLIIDYNGNIFVDGAKKVTAGFEMKLPLNSSALENLSSKMAAGVSIDARAVIDGVLSDLSNFAKETSDFISLSKLIDVIDEIYRKSKIAQLILLKNKLRAFQRQNIFADNIDETNILHCAMQLNDVVIFDVSNVPEEWQNEFINRAIIYPENEKKNFYLYLNINNNTDNKLLNYLLFKAVKDGAKPILAADYRHVAMDTVLDFSSNSFLFGTVHSLKQKECLSNILQSLPQDYFVINGKLTSSLSLPSYLGEPIETLDENIIEEKNKETNETLDIIQNTVDIEPQQIAEQPIQTNVDMNAINVALQEEQPIKLTLEEKFPVNDAKEEISEEDEEEAEAVEEEIVESPEELPNEQETLPEKEEELIILPEFTSKETDAQEVKPIEISDEDNFIEVTPENEPEELPEQEVELISLPEEDEILEEPQEYSEEESQEDDSDYEIAENNSNEQETDDIDLDDLDFLDDVSDGKNQYSQEDEDELLDLLSESDEVNQNEEINLDDIDFDEVDSSEPERTVPPKEKLPVYEANYEKTPKQSSIELNEGDLVKHNKYGLGTVKKLINHGNKIMCFINFEDFGRRLLDPEISQLEKIK